MKNKIILITGSRKGIGKFLTNYYLSNNNIVIGCSRSEDILKHKNYKFFQLNIKNELSVKKMFRFIRNEYGKLDVLINNAGTASMNHILTTPVESIDKLLETNFKGSFLMLREAGKLMMKKKYGKIVNMSTVATPLNLMGEAIYSSTKAAVEQLTKVSSKELSDFGITVNCLGPTPIETDLIKTVPKNKIDELLELQSIKRFGKFEDVLNVLNFFIDEKSDFITGQIIYLGGITR
ncbi:MAG: oxidoreductase [Cytophagia bacterium]|nr:oxidoreductase [Cytophagia bacterium]|tara:strand:+ start:153 stop:857 length:705 start_codon:yes stop_codon:yes gene_type:complete